MAVAQHTAQPLTSRLSTRWKIVGWIMLVTALALLAVTVTTRSVLLNQVAERANASIVQEAEEFRTFTAEGVDPTTAAPFSSVAEMLERYLSRQTPATGEALIGVAGADAADAHVLYLDNAGGGAGRELAQDSGALQDILDSAAVSGLIEETPAGPVRWGKVTAAGGADAEQGTLLVVQYLDRDLDAVESQVLVLFGVALGGLALTAGMAWLVSGRILKPVRQMRDAAAGISAADLSVRVPEEGDDEVAALARALNALLARVEQAQHAQQYFAVQARRYLESPRRRAETAIDQLAGAHAAGPHRDRLAAQARAALEAMRRTMDDLRIIAEQNTPDFVTAEPVRLADLAARVYTEAVSTHPHHRFDLDDTAADGTAWLDPRRVAEALRQLTENAADHGEPDTPVLIRVAASGHGPERTVSLSVQNHGMPMTAEDAERLFADYRDGREDDGPGMGFGLAVVRAVADAHGGSAWVESDDDGLTRFGLDLPAEHLAPAEDRAARFSDSVTASLREES